MGLFELTALYINLNLKIQAEVCSVLKIATQFSVGTIGMIKTLTGFKSMSYIDGRLIRLRKGLIFRSIVRL